MPADVPVRIGPYDIVRAVGSGRLGTFYQAFDEARTRAVGIRVLPPALLSDTSRLERFLRDIRASAGIAHDNVLRLLDEGRDGDLVYVVTEYVDGDSLFDRLTGSRLTLVEAIHVLRDVADGLEAVHRAGLVHGDLSPRAVFVSRDLSLVKVGNFGTAEAAPPPSGPVGTGALARTRLESALYRAPELAHGGGAATVCSDIYALGVIAYAAMTGKLPVGQFGLPSDVNEQIPLQLDPIVLKCLATDPAQRYQSLGALLADLDRVEEVVGYRLLHELKRLSGGRLFARKQDQRPAARRPWRNRPFGIRPWKVLAAAAVLAMVATAGLLLLGRDGGTRRVAAPGVTAPVTVTGPSPAQPAPSATPPQAPTASPTAAPAGSPPPVAGVPAPGAPAAEAAGQPSAARPAAPAPSSAMRAEAGRAGASAAGRAVPAKPAGPETAPPPGTGDADKAAGALYTEAQALIKANHDLEARAKLATIGERYSQSPWFVPAMMVKIGLEDRRGLKEIDPAIGQMAPASVQTKRLLIERAPRSPTTEAALWQLGEFYAGLKQYVAAVEAYVLLGTRFPNTRLDAWFKAGDILEKRLEKKADARAAYLKVPPASESYRDAQERARKLEARQP